MKVRTSSVVLASACLLVAASFAQATTLVDRGLPTFGVATGSAYSTNWAAQSNFQSGDADTKWVNTHFANYGATAVPGDDFTLPTSNAAGYHVTDIRVWIMGDNTLTYNYSDEFNGVGLMVGPKGGPLSVLAGLQPTVTTVGFPAGSGTTGGSKSLLWQLDYAVDFTGAAGQQFSYAILPDGKVNPANSGSTLGKQFTAFLEATASFAQTGANAGGDGYVQDFYYTDPTHANGTQADSMSFPNVYGGVPADDFSVQVFGEAVPEPMTMSLLGMGIVGLGGYIRRRAKVAK